MSDCLKNLFRVRHLEPLSKNYWFHACLFFPIVTGFLLGCSIWHDMSWDISPTGFAYFIEVSALPLGIMGLALPLTGLYGLMYRSKQAAHQISDSELRSVDMLMRERLKSFDAMHLLLFRIINHVVALNGLLELESLGKGDNKRLIEEEIRLIIDSWSLFYTTPVYIFGMSEVASHFNDIDSAMCNYQSIITNAYLNENQTQTVKKNSINLSKKPLRELKEGLDKLHDEVAENRKIIAQGYESQKKLIQALSGLS